MAYPVYFSARETFGMSINKEYLTRMNKSNLSISDLPSNSLSLQIRIGIAIPYLLWSIFGTFSNIMVVVLIASRRKMRTIFKLLLLNLALADIIITAVVIPILGSWQSLHYPIWQYSNVTCKVLNVSSHIGGLASGASLAFVSIYRFLVVKYPKRFSVNYRHLAITIILIWSVALAGGSISMRRANVTAMMVGGKLQRLCLMVHDTHSSERQELIFRVTMYFINSLFLLVLYTMITLHLKKTQVPGLHTVDGKQPKTDKNKRQAVNMMMVAAIGMIVCFFPYMTLVSINIFAKKGFYSAVPGIEILTNIVVSLNSVINPIIYCAFSSQLRKEFKELLNEWRCWFKSESGVSTKWFVKVRPRLFTVSSQSSSS